MKINHITTDAYTVNIAKTSKFKTIKIQVTFTNALTEETVTKRALLPYLLKVVNQKYTTRKELSIALEEMYAANFNAGVKKIGLTQQLVFDLTIIHNSYAEFTENLLEDAFQFLHDIFFAPLFVDSIFLEEKRLLDEYFLNIYSNKMRYAFIQCTNAMYQGEPFQLQPLGKQEDLIGLTIDDCKEAYQSMLVNDVINIGIVGDVDETEIMSLIKTYFPFEPRLTPITLLDKSLKPKRDVQIIKEQQEVRQGKLILGYQLPVYYLDDDYYATFLFHMILGGSPESLLFKRIREELNKVYNIASSYDQYKGSLLIYAGIDALDYDEVIEEINAIIQKIATKQFPDNTLEIAKKSLINGVIESLDSSMSMASRINNLALFSQPFNVEDIINQIHSITKEDISQISTKLVLDTSYLLRGDTVE